MSGGRYRATLTLSLEFKQIIFIMHCPRWTQKIPEPSYQVTTSTSFYEIKLKYLGVRTLNKNYDRYAHTVQFIKLVCNILS